MAKQTPASGAQRSPRGSSSGSREAAPKPGARSQAPPARDLSAIHAQDISFDEQIEIIGEINDVVERNRLEIRPDTFDFTPRKPGALVPILVNVLAVVVVILASLLLVGIFDQREQVLTGRTAALVTAESMIIGALREESQAELNAKDREIAQIRTRLEELRGERERLALDMDLRVREREVELRAALERELEAERRRLQEAGVSTAGIQQQLSALEARLGDERQRELAEFQRQAAAERAAKEGEIARLIGDYNSTLARFQSDRAALEQRQAQREAELQAQARAQSAAAESERVRIAGQLAQLQSERERERVVLDQILAQYSEVRGHLASGRYGEGAAALGRLEGFLAQGSVAAMPAVQKRLPIEGFTIASLRELIRLQQSATDQVQAAGQAEALLATLRDTVLEADRRARAGESAAAAALYQRALDTIPEVRRSHAALLEAAALGSVDDLQSLDQIQREMRQSEEALRRLQEQLRQAQAQLGRQNREISRLQAAEGSRQTLLQQVRELRSRYEGLEVRGQQSATIAQERVLELLEVKLQVRQALATEPIRSSSPGLYEALEEYLEAFGREQQQLGREAALEEALSVVDSLTRRGVRVDLQALKARYGGDPAHPFVRLLERLEALLR